MLADGAQRQGPVRARLPAVLPGERRAADLTGGTIAVPAAHTLAGLALIRAAFRIPRARRAEGQVGSGAEISPDRRFEAAVARGAVAVLVALAGTAEAAPGAALVVDTTQGTEREIATPDEWCTIINVSLG